MYARCDNPPAADRQSRMRQPSIVTKRMGEITWRISPDRPEYEIAIILDRETKMFYQLNATKAAPYKGPTEWSVVRGGRLIAEGIEPSLDHARTAAVAAYTAMTSDPPTPWTRRRFRTLPRCKRCGLVDLILACGTRALDLRTKRNVTIRSARRNRRDFSQDSPRCQHKARTIASNPLADFLPEDVEQWILNATGTMPRKSLSSTSSSSRSRPNSRPRGGIS
jgi:hypothetical protein